MILLTTTDIIRIVTSSGADVDVHADWVDNNAGTITPDNLNTKITTAATTTVVGSPAAGQRNLQNLVIRNIDASVQQTVTVEYYDGSTSVILFKATLAADESIVYTEEGNWQRFSAGGVPIAGANTGAADIQIFTTAGAQTWTKPTNFTPKVVIVEMIGAGGGGGAGASLATAVVAKGGGGGGGGSWVRGIFNTTDLGGTETVTLGTGGTAGAKGAAGAAGGDGGIGGNSTFGALLTAYGGGGGRGGAISALATGGGGGASVNATGATGSTSGGAGGIPTAATNAAAGQGVTGSVAVSTTSNAIDGGGAGAGIAATPVASSHGGGSQRGGGGGGA